MFYAAASRGLSRHTCWGTLAYGGYGDVGARDGEAGQLGILGSGILQGHRVLAVVWSSASVAPACNYLFTALSSSPRAMSFVLHLVPCNKLSYQVSLMYSTSSGRGSST